MERIRLAILAALIAGAGHAAVPGVVNSDFEQVLPDGHPVAWLGPAGQGTLSFTSDRGYRGKGGRLRVSGGPDANAAVVQKIDPAPYRGKLVRLRAMLKATTPGQAGLYLLVLRPDPFKIGFMQDNSNLAAPVGTWKSSTITGRIAMDATTIWIGLKATGGVDVSIDDVTLEEATPDSTPPSPAALAYLDQAIAILRAHHINSAKADWPRIIADAHTEIAGARTTADTYSAINDVIQVLGERHSYLQPPPSQAQIDAAAHAGPGGVPPGVELPGTNLIDGRIGLVRMPGLNFYAPGGPHSAEVYAETLRLGLQQLDKAPLCGWIIDLRDNIGGDMWPMLNGIDPLLGTSPFGFVVENGQKTAWQRAGGTIGMGTVAPDPPPPPAFTLRHAAAPVAVLIGPRTASSGEITAIALIARPDVRTFGAASAGFLSGNIVLPLPDGANLAVTTSLIADRTGKIYAGTIQPDAPTEPDAAEAAAKAWLEQQCRK